MKQIFTCAAIMVFGLFCANEVKASGGVVTDFAVEPASIAACWEIGDTDYEYVDCTYHPKVVNYGPSLPQDYRIIDQIFPSSATNTGPIFQVTGGPCSGFYWGSNCWEAIYDIILKKDVVITHVVGVSSPQDPNTTNNTFIETFKITNDAQVIPLEIDSSHYNNFYNNGYNNHYNNGYNNGYMAPWDIQSNGWNNGYNNNYNNGYNNGYIAPY